MKYISLLLFLLYSCGKRDVYPIERYKGDVFIKVRSEYSTTSYIIMKNKDSIYNVEVLNFDLEKYNEGDTIR